MFLSFVHSHLRTRQRTPLLFCFFPTGRRSSLPTDPCANAHSLIVFFPSGHSTSKHAPPRTDRAGVQSVLVSFTPARFRTGVRSSRHTPGLARLLVSSLRPSVHAFQLSVVPSAVLTPLPAYDLFMFLSVRPPGYPSLRPMFHPTGIPIYFFHFIGPPHEQVICPALALPISGPRAAEATRGLDPVVSIIRPITPAALQPFKRAFLQIG